MKYSIALFFSTRRWNLTIAPAAGRESAGIISTKLATITIPASQPSACARFRSAAFGRISMANLWKSPADECCGAEAGTGTSVGSREL